ncbi:hypothetical protein KM539_00270 [Xanthomonas translucens pv. poae]|uniref:hypothetical protein n=1 Tax=Xanthomonas graminis TaxID=3390026 RepID=UPI0014810D82|nr:hypothetical protein [Xanthomonas translucens]UKE62061.1 hypothetical protein KM539_00270 [Xanthomonas translucens pv. poae]
MAAPRKIVLHSLHGYRTDLEPLVVDWIRESGQMCQREYAFEMDISSGSFGITGRFGI